VTTRLMRDTISRDVLEAFEQLAEGARQGLIVGAVFGVALKGRRYHVNVAGSLVRDPTFARGVVAALDDELMALVQGRADADSTL
jgi:hypothetical protein